MLRSVAFTFCSTPVENEHDVKGDRELEPGYAELWVNFQRMASIETSGSHYLVTGCAR